MTKQYKVTVRTFIEFEVCVKSYIFAKKINYYCRFLFYLSIYWIATLFFPCICILTIIILSLKVAMLK